MARLDTVLSWNMGCGPKAKIDDATRTRRIGLLTAMVNDFEVRIAALQEAPAEADLRAALGMNFDLIRTLSGVATAYDTRYWSCDKRATPQNRIAIFGLLATGSGTSLWVVNVHGPALHVDDDDKRKFVGSVVRELEIRRGTCAGRSELVAGDMNLPPFHPAIMRSTGYLASRCLPWVAARTTGIARALFNPTWTVFGRTSGASGTFYQSDVAADGPWCAIDQILVSPDLVGPGCSLDIVEEVRNEKLRTSGPIGAPDKSIGSDHLPLRSAIAIA